MSKQMGHMPYCRTCGPLGPAMRTTPAFDVVETHRRSYPHHQTSVIPTKTSIIVKGTSKWARRTSKHWPNDTWN